MSERPAQQLNVSGRVTLDASGNGTVSLGPGKTPGPRTWNITQVTVQTNRPGLAPVPRFQLYRDFVSPDNSLGLDYDGSFNQGLSSGNGTQLTVPSEVICVWTGGQSGDIATLTVTGTKV